LGDHDLAIVTRIIIFLSSFSFLSILITQVTDIVFVSIASLAWFTGGTITIAGACVVATGLPCAGALAIYALITLAITYFTTGTGFTWISTLIFIPLTAILIIFIARMGRGN
jgi:hypothetical protein